MINLSLRRAKPKPSQFHGFILISRDISSHSALSGVQLFSSSHLSYESSGKIPFAGNCGADLISKYFGETFDKYPVKNGGKKPCLTFSHVNTRRPYREIQWSNLKGKTRLTKVCHNDTHIIWWLKENWLKPFCEMWDPIYTKELLTELLYKMLSSFWMDWEEDNAWQLMRDRMYWSVFVDCCRATKMPQKSNCC